jgi:hypothetical protein
MRGVPSGAMALSAATPHVPRRRRAAADSREHELSVSSCRTMRMRSAPSARRTAISPLRPDGARQQQVGDVHAGDEQHERDGALQHEQRRPHAADALLCSGTGLMPLPVSESGCAAGAAREAVEPRARLSIVTPARSRPNVWKTAELRDGFTRRQRIGRHMTALGT